MNVNSFLTLEQKMNVQKAIQSALGYSPSLDAIDIRNGYTRFDTAKRGHLNGFFRIYIYKDSLVVYFGDWSIEGASYVWREKEASGEYKPITKEQNREITEALERQKEEDERVRREAIEIMKDRFDDLPSLDSMDFIHPYLKKKGLTRSYIGKYDVEKDVIVFPFYDSTGHLTGLQEIDEYGNKKIVRYSKKKGSYSLLRFKNTDYSRVYACEGFATGISIFEATGAPVIVCIDAGNIEGAVHSACDYLNIFSDDVVIVADNDESGTGEEEARKACDSLQCSYIVIPYEGMDANDYAQEYGLEFLHSLLVDGVDAWKTVEDSDLEESSIDYGENDEQGEEDEE